MTEEEANRKICGISCASETPVACDASECMAWRWIPLSTSDIGYLEACRKAAQMKGEDGKPMGQKWAAAYVNAHRAEFGLGERPSEGYCGLAGKP